MNRDTQTTMTVGDMSIEALAASIKTDITKGSEERQPKGFYSSEELAKQWGIGLSVARQRIKRAMALGKYEIVTVKKMCAGGWAKPVPYYGLKRSQATKV